MFQMPIVSCVLSLATMAMPGPLCTSMMPPVSHAMKLASGPASGSGQSVDCIVTSHAAIF